MNPVEQSKMGEKLPNQCRFTWRQECHGQSFIACPDLHTGIQAIVNKETHFCEPYLGVEYSTN